MHNAATLAVSLLALAVSAVTAWRQFRHTRTAKAFSAVLEVYLRDVRNKEYQRDQDYVVDRLVVEHSPGGGIAGLPEQARHAVWNVAFLYESIGMMYALEALDRRIALGVFNYRTVQVWGVLEPFVLKERERREGPFLHYFQRLYDDAIAVDVEELYRKSGPRIRGRRVPWISRLRLGRS
ncbi:hypothetical protein V1J52_16920 [Streptomyces sp. TRM 70351]|uniref:DUF4760 domain-containing protein n=1 Tax=Streptomyces sp. TRM 70351 TaxID=3116552 RepID=UPI002E7C05B1|nr:hypothetical protein [Streptomyces sp. TRM 70351]MEE1929845.1 hypothetical protein [Streptomyces sp. TRM 70351]